MMKKVRISLITLVAIFALLFGTYKLMNARSFQLFGGIITHVQTTQKVVAITFDDGPTTNVEELLPLLNKYHAKATFFVVGNELEDHLEIGKAIAEAGHQIGNHSYSHQRMIFKTPTFIKQEINKTNELIKQTGYKGEIDFRPPNGKKLVLLPYYLHKNKMDTIMWSLEPDTFYTGVQDKVNYVKENVEPGEIILFHPMYDKTSKELEAIEGVLKALSKQEYRFVTVNELKALE